MDRILKKDSEATFVATIVGIWRNYIHKGLSHLRPLSQKKPWFPRPIPGQSGRVPTSVVFQVKEAMTYVKAAVAFALASFLCLVSASPMIAQTRQINPNNLQIVQYERITQTVEEGELVMKKRSVEYRIRYGPRDEIRFRSHSILYVRTRVGTSVCSSSWRKYVIRRQGSNGESGTCVTELQTEPMLENLRHIFQDDFDKLVQIHTAAPHPSIGLMSFEAWLHPKHWGDRVLHELIIARARAKAT